MQFLWRIYLEYSDRVRPYSAAYLQQGHTLVNPELDALISPQGRSLTTGLGLFTPYTSLAKCFVSQVCFAGGGGEWLFGHQLALPC